jgi:hypothetical protein
MNARPVDIGWPRLLLLLQQLCERDITQMYRAKRKTTLLQTCYTPYYLCMHHPSTVNGWGGSQSPGTLQMSSRCIWHQSLEPKPASTPTQLDHNRCVGRLSLPNHMRSLQLLVHCAADECTSPTIPAPVPPPAPPHPPPTTTHTHHHNILHQHCPSDLLCFAPVCTSSYTLTTATHHHTSSPPQHPKMPRPPPPRCPVDALPLQSQVHVSKSSQVSSFTTPAPPPNHHLHSVQKKHGAPALCLPPLPLQSAADEVYQLHHASTQGQPRTTHRCGYCGTPHFAGWWCYCWRWWRGPCC